MKKIVLAYIASCLLFSARCFAVDGFVTPTTVNITFNSASLIGAENNSTQVVSTSTSHAFNRTDTDLVASSLGTISVPRGRYTGVSVCYNTSRSVVLNGVRYDGTTVASHFTDGDHLWTTGSDATATNTVANSGTSGTTLSGLVVGSGTENCSQTTFAAPICVAVAADQASTCSTGDTMIDPTVTSPDLQLMLDMYHCIGIDAHNNMLDPHVACYPYATIGKPGAAIHLAYSSGGTYGDIVLIFGNDKKLSYTSAGANGTISNFCGGVGATTVTAGPAGAYLNTFGGPTWVMSFDSTSGKVQFATGNCPSGPSSCSSSGMLTMNNVLQQYNSTVNVSCPADSAATPPYLGFTYPSGSGNGSSTVAFTVTRIVDPYNLFGICDSGKPGYVTGSMPSGATGGTCGNYP